jgi:hypothetical protein
MNESLRDLEMSEYYEWYEWIAERHWHLFMFAKDVRRDLNMTFDVVVKHKIRRLFGCEQS